MAFNVDNERQSFEDWAYNEYVAQEQTNRIGHPEIAEGEWLPIMSRESFLTRDPDFLDRHAYAIVGLDSAWIAWQERAKRAYDATARTLELVVGGSGG